MIEIGVRTYDNVAVGRVVHGVGAFEQLPELLSERGARRVVLVSTRSVIAQTDYVSRARDMLGDRFVGLADPIGSHSPLPAVDALVRMGEDTRADAIVAIGGSSVTDAAKLASLRVAGGTAQMVLRNGRIEHTPVTALLRPVTLINIPTTLSAGEFTNGAGCVDESDQGKVIAVDDRHMAWAVILDPILTLATPRTLWKSSAVKAIDHAAEAMWSRMSHPVGDALSAAAIDKLMRHLPQTIADPNDLAARLECQIGSWLSVASIQNTGLELSHLLEHAIGAYWHLPHGITSCVGLPSTMAYLATRQPEKVAAVARAMGTPIDPAETMSGAGLAGARRLQEWIAELGLPIRLRDLVSDWPGLDKVADIALAELRFFDRVPEGGRETVRDLLEMIWDGTVA